MLVRQLDDGASDEAVLCQRGGLGGLFAVKGFQCRCKIFKRGFFVRRVGWLAAASGGVGGFGGVGFCRDQGDDVGFQFGVQGIALCGIGMEGFAHA